MAGTGHRMEWAQNSSAVEEPRPILRGLRAVLL